MKELLRGLREKEFLHEVNNLSYKLLNKPFANISYKDDIIGKDGLDELVNKVSNFWTNIGFVSGLDVDKVNELSFAYTFFAEQFSKNGDEFDDFDCTIIFPIARRVVTALETGKFDVKMYLKLYKEHFNIQYLISRLKRRTRFWKNAADIDYEAEICVVVANSLIEAFENGSFENIDLFKMKNYDKLVGALEARN